MICKYCIEALLLVQHRGRPVKKRKRRKKHTPDLIEENTAVAVPFVEPCQAVTAPQPGTKIKQVLAACSNKRIQNSLVGRASYCAVSHQGKPAKHTLGQAAKHTLHQAAHPPPKASTTQKAEKVQTTSNCPSTEAAGGSTWVISSHLRRRHWQHQLVAFTFHMLHGSK